MLPLAFANGNDEKNDLALLSFYHLRGVREALFRQVVLAAETAGCASGAAGVSVRMI